MVRQTDLSSQWLWKERTPSVISVLDELKPGAGHDWDNATYFPSEIHVELMKLGRIPDPYVGFNEHEVQWVGKREWLYTCTYDFQREGEDKYAKLVFEGLDTFCDVYLNGNLILSADNMFRTYSVSINLSTLKPSYNVLLLHFKSAQLIAKSLETKYGRVRAGSVNLGDPSRVYVRKAQYNWRWDWGPELMTCGPYRPIKLITYTARLASIRTQALVSSPPGLSRAFGCSVSLSGDLSFATSIRVTIVDPINQKILRSEDVPLSKELPVLAGEEDHATLVSWPFRENEVDLWWPVGYGAQKLYTVEVRLFGQDDVVMDEQTRTIGFRHVELVQEPLQEPDQYGAGTTFLFEVNGVRMFIGGSNWIPADNMLTLITPERYRAWLTLLRDGNQNMVRLWGGGVYEPDVFYDTCDELGILVWQDFQFACGVYPAHDAFVASVKAEAEDNVKRLRHHPSIALFCGNNEDYQQVLQWGGISDLPAQKIYESILPSVVSCLTDPKIPYHRGSPYGGKGWDTADPTVGDVHQWNIWAGEKPWHDYDRMGGRFVSEFGIPSMPDMRTIDYWMGDDVDQRYAQSKLMAQHCKAGSFERRFAVLMNELFRLTDDLGTHAYQTQLLQSEAVSYAYRMWRREWKGRGHEYTGGALVWQLNDSWPVTSWSIVDYFLRPKPAYYSIARELKPITVGIFRTVTKNRENDRPRQFYEFGSFRVIGANIQVWGTNSTPDPAAVDLELTYISIGTAAWTRIRRHAAMYLRSNACTELIDVPVPCPPGRSELSHEVVVGARLLDPSSGRIVARHIDWPQPYKYRDFGAYNPELNLSIIKSDLGPRGKDEVAIRVDVKKPVKGLVLSAEEEDDDEEGGVHDEVRWGDNALDVIPGDTQEVIVSGLKGRKIRAKYLGHEHGDVFKLF